MAGPATSLPNVAVRWDGRHLQILDQTLLPAREQWLELTGSDDTAAAIARLAVRGAPNIGIAAAYGLAMAAASGAAAPAGPDAGDLQAAADHLRAARPTAVNLAWAVDRVLAAALAAPPPER
ncbi:MAG: methylthioribose-phosphate isomerase, partial [Solirubrobacteraceae bacterium]|nr:methylthioribose-phosphate isomerase [Solirubrobacteraceae bacterium]